MKRLISLAAVAALTAAPLAAPQLAAAQSTRNYGSVDPCAAQKRSAGNKGAITGALVGALVGGGVAGNGAKTEGAVLGAGLGAVAGHQIAKRNVRCTAYPNKIAQRSNCRWVHEYYGGRDHAFEVCRNHDGVWRPSGRG